MTKSSAAAEPSMEEILASIRRIISDGEEAAGRGPADAADAAPTAEAGESAMEAGLPDEGLDDASPHNDDDRILELTDDMLADEPAAVGGRLPPVEPVAPDVVFDTPREGHSSEIPDDTAPPDAGVAEHAAPAAPPEEGWAGTDSGQDTTSDLASGEADEHLLSPATDAKVAATFSRLANTILMNDARTLDDLVKEMMRPMLKEWLDDNLPHIVERLVREEIERVSRGRG